MAWWYLKVQFPQWFWKSRSVRQFDATLGKLEMKSYDPQAHAFYKTESDEVANVLLELFRGEYSQSRKNEARPRFEVVPDESLSVPERVLFDEAIERAVKDWESMAGGYEYGRDYQYSCRQWLGKLYRRAYEWQRLFLEAGDVDVDGVQQTPLELVNHGQNQTNLTVKDVDCLLGDFKWLRNPPAPKLTERDEKLWRQAIDEAWQAEEQHAKKVAAAVAQGGSSPGDVMAALKQRKAIRTACEKHTGKPSTIDLSPRFRDLPEQVYRRLDSAYAKAEGDARRKVADETAAVRKRLDLLLVSIKLPLLQWSELSVTYGPAQTCNTYQAAVQHDAEAYRKKMIDTGASATRKPPAIDMVAQDLERIKAKMDRQASVKGTGTGILPAEIATLLERGDFPELAEDEYLKLGAWLSANAHKVSHSLDPANVAKTQQIEEAKKRLRTIYEYNSTLREQATAPPATQPGQQAQAGRRGATGEPSEAEATQKKPMSQRAQTAYQQWQQAMNVLTGKDGRAPTDQQCYEWMKAHNDGNPLPAVETWQRYLRHARKYLGEQKNTPQTSREHGRSIVLAKDIEPPETDEAD